MVYARSDIIRPSHSDLVSLAGFLNYVEEGGNERKRGLPIHLMQWYSYGCVQIHSQVKKKRKKKTKVVDR